LKIKQKNQKLLMQ